MTSHQEQLFQRKIVKPIPFTLQHGTSHQQVLLQERASCTCMCTSLGTTTSPNTELMSIDFRLGRKHCNERQFSARKRSMCLHSALAQDVLAPVDPWHHGGKAKLNKRNALTATIWTWVIYLSSSLWIGSHPFLGFSHWDKFKIERDFDLTHSTWTSKLMVQIYLAGQTCGKIEETSRSWWQWSCEAVKWSCLLHHVSIQGWTGTSSIHDSDC